MLFIFNKLYYIEIASRYYFNLIHNFNQHMKKLFLSLLISCMLCGVCYAQNHNVIEYELQEVMNQKGDEMIDVTIVLKSQIDDAKLQAMAGRTDDKMIQREIVVNELKDFSSRQQADVMSVLKAEETNGNVTAIRSLWIVNAISCETSRDVIYQLSTHPDVAVISYNNEVGLIAKEDAALIETSSTRGPASHVVTVNADDVWNQGYTGKNVIVAVLDSGTNIFHNDLKDHLWEGDVDGETVNGWNVIANNSNIVDDNGHGTHCAGIVCGDGTSGTTSGVAPDANLMTVKTLAATGTGSVDNMIAGVQFAIEHGADILSISYGFKSYQISVAQKELIRDAFNEVLTAGAIVCAAVGNDGNTIGAPYNVDYPSACPSPWKNPDQTLAGGLSSVIAVGADDLATSSQGPSTWQDTDFNDYQYSKWTHYCAFTNSLGDYGGKYSQNDKPFYWAVKYTPSMLTGYSKISKVSVFGSDINPNVSISIYVGGDNAPETLKYEHGDVTLDKMQWNEVELREDIEVNSEENLWIVFKSYEAIRGNTYATADSRYYSADGTNWTDISTVDESTSKMCPWLVRGYFEDNDGNTSTVGLIRPDITAPGNLIYSLDHLQNGVYELKTGTSQSTPCVAGVIALMLEKNSSLTPAKITEIIETTAADKPAAGKNNRVGAGRVDALAAVNATTAGEQNSYMTVISFSPKTLVPGDNKNINVIIENQGHKATTSEAQYTISMNDDPYVTVVGSNTVALGAINPKGIKETSFKVNVNADTPNGHIVYITLTLKDGSLTRKENIAINVEKLPHVVYKTHTPSQIKPEDGNVNLNVTMINDGTAAMANSTDVTLKTISTSLNHFEIIDGEATIPSLGVGETATATFVIKAKEEAKDGYLLDLFLETFSNNATPMNFVYGFETGMESWTSFDAANNNIATPWWHSSEAVIHGLQVVESHYGDGHIMSETMIRNNGQQFYANPIDNYIVSPKKFGITENSEISFYARANHEGYYQEHFGLAVSETGNVNESDFTLIKEWDITESTKSWNKYTVDLSQYKGKEIYVAIRHFFTDEQWENLDNGFDVEALDIDDICLSDVIIDFQHTTTFDGTDENYFNVAIFNPIDLGAPTGLDVTGTTTESITLIWDELANAQSYNVYRDGEKVANVTEETYTDNGLVHNTEYCYTVTGMNNVYEYEHSDEVCTMTLQKDYNTAIKEFTPEVVYYDGNEVSLDITFINDGIYEHESKSSITISTEDEYVTMTSATGSMAALKPTEEVTKLFAFTLDENIPNNRQVTFNANVKYMYGNTSWDIPFTMVVKNDPNSPKNLNATAKTENSVTLEWSSVPSAVRYNVYRDDVFVGNTTATSYYDGGLNAETEYRYSVTSVTADGESERSKELAVTTNKVSNGIILHSFTMGSAIGENVELTATLINKGSETTPDETTATLSCDDSFVTIIDGTYDIGSIAAGATKDAVFTIKLDENIPSNYKLDFNVTTEYQSTGTSYQNYEYSFDTDFEGWTAYDYYINNNHTWYHSSESASHSPAKPESYAGEGHLMNATYCSKHNSYDASDIVWSPSRIRISENTMISFYVRSTGTTDRFCKDSYYIVYSDNVENPGGSFDDFFVYYQLTTSEKNQWNYKEYSLSSQNGKEIWVGIFHEANDDNADGLCIDEVTFTNVLTEGNTTISHASSFSVIANQSLNIFAGTGLWSNSTLWSKGLVPSTTDDVIVAGDATIESGNITVNTLSIEEGSLTMNGGVLTVSGLLVNTDADALIINEGAQVFQNNDNVAATFKMNVVNWNDVNSWQFMASPLTNVVIEDFVPTTGYDLFKYDGTQTNEWYNYKGHVNDFEKTFYQGRGYLVSYETETSAIFKGMLNNENSFNFSDVSTYIADDHFANFYLLGNPFTFDMKWNDMTTNNIYDNGYATINVGGSYTYHSGNDIISVGDGFFVLTTGENPSLSYGASSKNERSFDVNSLNITSMSNEGSDNVILTFAGQENEGFTKLDNFNENIAIIYVENNGGRYGVMSYDENTTEVELCFHANRMGSYTIGIEPDGKFKSVTLIDKFTGIETNMLVEDYNFTATSGDNVNRFIVKLVNGQQTTDNIHFVYQSGEDLIIDAEGVVQIIDVMGRVVYSDDVESTNNRINVSDFGDGTYVVRVINETEVKVEKVVIY